MTPTEIKIIRAKYNLTQEQLGEKIGVTRQTIATYEKESPIPLSIQLALKYLESTYEQEGSGGSPAID